MDKSLVFVSHATSDRQYAELLGNYIERTIKNTRVFVASAPTAIPSGSDWFREILRNLSGADALVIVFSRNAQSGLWLGFELGYFWRKHHGNDIHCVFDPTLELPSPLNELQAKDFTNDASIAILFRGLAKDLGRNYDDDQRGIMEIVDAVPKYDEFAKWKALLANGEWLRRELSGEHGNKTVWTSVEDPSYQIENTYEVEVENFSEPWTKGFPDPHASSYNVNLNISGATMHQELFVSLDGGRYFVPIPEVRVENNSLESYERSFIYDSGSLRFLLGKVIGRFYFSDSNLVVFAARHGIEIH